MSKLKIVVLSGIGIWFVYLAMSSDWNLDCREHGTCLLDYMITLLLLSIPVIIVLMISTISKVDIPVLALIVCAIVPLFFIYTSISGDANSPLIIVVMPFYVIFVAGIAFVADVLFWKFHRRRKDR